MCRKGRAVETALFVESLTTPRSHRVFRTSSCDASWRLVSLGGNKGDGASKRHRPGRTAFLGGWIHRDDCTKTLGSSLQRYLSRHRALPVWSLIDPRRKCSRARQVLRVCPVYRCEHFVLILVVWLRSGKRMAACCKVTMLGPTRLKAANSRL